MEEYYTREKDYTTVEELVEYMKAVVVLGDCMKAVQVPEDCMKAGEVGDCMKVLEQVHCMKVVVMEGCMKAGEQVRCMKVGVMEHYRKAQEVHMMAVYLGDYMRVEDQEDCRLMVEVLESCKLVVGRVGCTWVEVQVFHTYLAHYTTVLALEHCRMPQVQVGCTRSLRHSTCSHRSRDH